MRRVRCYIATSLDGYIAGPQGEIDWLGEPGGEEDYGYAEFIRGVGAIVIGRTTYEQVLEGAEWPCKGIETYVMSRSRQAGPSGPVVITAEPADALVKRLREGDGDIWLVGGGKVLAEFRDAGLVDEWIVTIVPIILGNGISMWLPGHKRERLTLTRVQAYSSGFVQIRYVAEG